MRRVSQILDPTRTGQGAQRLEANLRRKLIGQDEAIQQIVSLYQTHQSGLAASGRPIGTLLFLGPTGSGKTRAVEATAESLIGDAEAVVKIDCAEFQHSHEIAKLIGSPPGYLGHRETHPLLSQEVLDRHHTEKVKISFVLFDEIEKASDALWRLLLGVLDKATLTLGDNRKVDFSRAMIFMTSNLGAAEMESILRPAFGFAASGPRQDNNSGPAEQVAAGRISHVGVAAARRKFSPEFINRLDRIVVFRPLGESELRAILDVELGRLQERIFRTGPQAFVVALTDAAKSSLLREGTDLRYGARPLKRAIERALVHPLSNLLASEQVHGGDLVRVDFSDDIRQLLFYKDAEHLPPAAMAQLAHAGAVMPLELVRRVAA